MKTTITTLFLLLSFTFGATADTFTVNNIFDPGNGTCDDIGCTLREAIDAANTNAGSDVINFNIASTGVQTIALTGALPDIIETVTIDGYTQPGASANTLDVGNNAVLLIEVDGSGAPGNGYGRCWNRAARTR